MTDSNSRPDIDSLQVQRALGASISGVELLQAHTAESGGEARESQETMCSSVHEAIQNRENIFVQAGTGTGKSLAYLAAAVASKSGRTVISTATNQLSDQLFYKDCPALQETAEKVGESFTFASLKGRQNYLCLAKAAQIEEENAQANNKLAGLEDTDDENQGNDSSLVAKAKAESREINALLEWSKETESGERSESPAARDSAWRKLSVSSKQCPGASKCPFGEECFAERARRKAKSADVVITNHALLSQHANQRSESGIDLFGKVDNLIVDEAHNLPASLTSALSFQVSESYVRETVKDVIRVTQSSAEAVNPRSMDTLVEEFGLAMLNLDSGRITIKPAALKVACQELIQALLNSRKIILKIAKQAATKGEYELSAKSEIALSSVDALIVELNVVQENPDESTVQWTETNSQSGEVSLMVSPLDVSAYFQKMTESMTVVGTSATLKVGSSFTPMLESLGMENAKTLDVGSPFDYKNQGILFVPDESYPAPVGTERFDHTRAVQESLLKLVSAARGRSLCLFTTTKGALDAGEYLREHLPENINVLVSGEAAADKLVQMFREDETSVLCATMGMWQGTDIPGNACVLVAIDKIPFPSPEDILNQARSENATNKGRNGFYAVSVSQAAINLAQGVGRLIRTQQDRGVVAILDSRLRTKTYGATLLQSLPEFTLISEQAKVEGALSRLTENMKESTVIREKFTPKPKPSAAKKSNKISSGKNGSNLPRSSKSTRRLGKR